MKKIFILLLLVVDCLFTACGNKNNSIENELPLLIMVNDTLFQYSSDQEIQFDIPATGTIDTIIYDKVPDKNNQATFGKEGMEYWLIDEEKLYVNLKDKMLYFILESEFH